MPEKERKEGLDAFVKRVGLETPTVYIDPSFKSGSKKGMRIEDLLRHEFLHALDKYSEDFSHLALEA